MSYWIQKPKGPSIDLLHNPYLYKDFFLHSLSLSIEVVHLPIKHKYIMVRLKQTTNNVEAQTNHQSKLECIRK